MNTEPIRGDSIVHERSEDSPETSELKPDIKQRKKESVTLTSNDSKESDNEECVRTIDTKAIHDKELVCETDNGDVSKYTDVKKDIKVTANETRDSRLRRKPAERSKKAADDSYVPTGRRQIQQSIRDMFPVRRSTRKCKTLIEVSRWRVAGV